MEFGPEIKVDGKRPEWLEDDDVITIRAHDGYEAEGKAVNFSSTDFDWWPRAAGEDQIIAIRLPANHPHYTTPTPDERAVALVKRIASETSMAAWLDHTAEARAIVADLEPVDADLVEARKIAGLIVEYEGGDEIKAGNWDDSEAVQAALQGLRRGRQLEKEGK